MHVKALTPARTGKWKFPAAGAATAASPEGNVARFPEVRELSARGPPRRGGGDAYVRPQPPKDGHYRTLDGPASVSSPTYALRRRRYGFFFYLRLRPGRPAHEGTVRILAL